MPQTAMKTPAYTSPGTPRPEAERAMMNPTAMAHMQTMTKGEREPWRSENQATTTERTAAVI